MTKLVEWQSGSGKWNVGDTSNLANDSNAWYRLPQLLNMSYENFVTMLINTYHAKVKFNTILLYDWDNYNDAHRFLLDMNKRLRSMK